MIPWSKGWCTEFGGKKKNINLIMEDNCKVDFLGKKSACCFTCPSGSTHWSSCPEKLSISNATGSEVHARTAGKKKLWTTSADKYLHPPKRSSDWCTEVDMGHPWSSAEFWLNRQQVGQSYTLLKNLYILPKTNNWYPSVPVFLPVALQQKTTVTRSFAFKAFVPLTVRLLSFAAKYVLAGIAR